MHNEATQERTSKSGSHYHIISSTNRKPWCPNDFSLSPEEAQQIHDNPDVAFALLSVEKDPINQVDEVSVQGGEKAWDSQTNTDDSKSNTTISSTETIDASPADDPPPSATPSPPAIDVTPHDSEQLHMKPDVAAAILTS